MTNLPLPIQRAYWVVPGLFLAGQYPGTYQPEQTRQSIDKFLQAGITTFIDLTTPNELPPYEPVLREQAALFEKTVHYHRFPIGDFGIPSPRLMQQILDTIDQSLANHQAVYVHCWGGIGRTGTTVGCYLARHGTENRQALTQVNQWCFYAESPETSHQKRFVLDWQEP